MSEFHQHWMHAKEAMAAAHRADTEEKRQYFHMIARTWLRSALQELESEEFAIATFADLKYD